ncbi:lytic transglycosylase domain-containing protein [Caldovatus aquaticus]|uniref:Lytic transglycosylase domain-containing protein n=1 Tax=Caldovatus aquaticus TaxID=2865671 RepID=A0ABS7F2X8_9PROT|nr:lytic transglycosylase domain-containing protein [Caldovatus aquaticus]MBW8269347.1 lytic transglycosylase domain-containing protein [Caldovatus aquaticus]
MAGNRPRRTAAGIGAAARRRAGAPLLLFALLAITAAPARAAPGGIPGPDPAQQCRAAIQAAERSHNLPPQLLQAIARVESGRRDPATGAVSPWPWTVNAEGQGRHFDTREEAIAHVRQLQARGVRLIDVGCLQINLHHHPRAFASLEEAFDPAANARYAARFLNELYAARRDWTWAAAHYHSQTPELAEAYRGRVLAAWPAEQRRPYTIRDEMAYAWAQAGGARAGGARSALASVASGAAVRDRMSATEGPAGGAPNGFQALALSLSNRAERARLLPLAGQGGGGRAAGRGLDAYRAAPIAIAGRSAPMLQVAEAPPDRRAEAPGGPRRR